MKNILLYQFLDKTLTTFIQSSILRVSIGGLLEYTYSLGCDEIKAVASSQRLHANLVADYLRTFNVDVTHNKKFNFFTIVIDLRRIALTPAQSDELTRNIEVFKACKERDRRTL